MTKNEEDEDQLQSEGANSGGRLGSSLGLERVSSSTPPTEVDNALFDPVWPFPLDLTETLSKIKRPLKLPLGNQAAIRPTISYLALPPARKWPQGHVRFPMAMER